MGDDNGTAAILDFAFRQSYGKSIGTAGGDGGAATTARPGIGGGQRRRLAPDVSLTLRAAPYPVTAVQPVPPSAPIDALLAGALGVQRHEPFNTYNPHAAIPSPRAVFSVAAFVVDRGAVWRYLPFRHELEQVGTAPPGPPGAVHVCLAARYTAIPASYGELRYALAVLEAGHAIANLVLVGMALGLHSRVELAFPDQALLDLLRLDAGDGWMPCAVLTFAPDGDNALRGTLPLGDGPAPPAPPTQPHDEVAAVDRAGWIAGPAPQGWTHRPGPRATSDVTGAAPDGDLASVLWRRSSGRGPRGLSGSRVTVPGAALQLAAREAARRDVLWGSLAARTADVSAGVRTVWVTQRVDGVPDGMHEIDAAAGQLVTVREGRFFDHLQQGFSYPATATALTTMNVVGLVVADYPALLARLGPRGWRLANLEMGAAMQAASLAFASAGMFARPCRSFHEYVLDDLLGLDATQTVGYELIAGVDRFSDLSLDLRM